MTKHINFVSRFCCSVISFYQKYISPTIHGKETCRFIPTCSEYTYQAIQKYGAIKGVLLGIKRIFKCHPLGGFGYDPVP